MASPWVKIFQQTCALKEQKEGERTSILLSPVALTARQIVNELKPRVLPWAVFQLGLRPVFARNHFYCTLRWVISLSGLCLVIAVIVVAAHCVGLFSFWGFAPSLLVILAAAHCVRLFSFRASHPLLPLIVVTTRCPGLFSYSGFAPPLLVILAAGMHVVFFVGWVYSLSYPNLACFITRPCRSVRFRCYDK